MPMHEGLVTCIFWYSPQGCLGCYRAWVCLPLSDRAHRWFALFQKNFQTEFIISAHSEYGETFLLGKGWGKPKALHQTIATLSFCVSSEILGSLAVSIPKLVIWVIQLHSELLPLLLSFLQGLVLLSYYPLFHPTGIPLVRGALGDVGLLV